MEFVRKVYLMHKSLRCFFAMLCILVAATPSQALADSRYLVAPDDHAAVYLTQDSFAVRADGVHDDTQGIQAAIDQAWGARSTYDALGQPRSL